MGCGASHNQVKEGLEPLPPTWSSVPSSESLFSTGDKHSSRTNSLFPAPSNNGDRKKNGNGSDRQDQTGLGSIAAKSDKLQQFALQQLQSATGNFDKRNVLGKGGFGMVFQGRMPRTEVEGGKAKGITSGPVEMIGIAVKQLNDGSSQGYGEWMQEILVLGQVHHPSVVRLFGFCDDCDENLLVYELCENGSVDSALFNKSSKVTLNWSKRVQIAHDCAQALAYLHDKDIIHRDFKAANVLLDQDCRARVADFGLARVGPEGNEIIKSTRILGTPGYLDPDYAVSGQLTKMADVYSFGVFLLVLMSGRKAICEDNGEYLTQRLLPILNDNRASSKLYLDPSLGNDFSEKEARKLKVLARYCLQEIPFERPPALEVAESIATMCESLQTGNKTNGAP